MRSSQHIYLLLLSALLVSGCSPHAKQNFSVLKEQADALT